MKRISARLWVLFALCLGCGGALFAQGTSQISGTVKDASGSVVAGAQVTVTQTDTGVTRTAISDAGGFYSLPSLPVGPYKLEVKKDGFSAFVQTGIVLQVASAPAIDPVLQVGSVNQSVQVESSSTITIETSSTGVGQVVNSQDVVDLPLNGRQVTQLITLAGASNTVQSGFGQAPSVGNLISSKNYPNEALVSVGGGLLNGTTYLLDGGTFNDPFNNLNLPTPFPDAIQEFNVQTSALPAQYGQHSAGAINMVSKSGTNQFHGDAFEFVRNADFNARDYFTFSSKAPDGASDDLKRNQFGGTIGGPIKKDKIFFFLGYQGTLLRSQPAALAAVLPTPSELTGNFQAYEANCFGGKPQTLNPALYTNNILITAPNPQALAFASYFGTGPEPCGNVTYRIIQNQNEHMGVGKVDYQINSKQSLFVRYFGTHSLQPSSFTGNQLSVQNAGTNDMVNSVVLGHTYLISTNAVNTFHFAFNTVGITKFQVPIETPTDIGVQGMYTSGAPFTHFSNINITGDFQSAGGFATPGLVNTKTYQFADDFSWTKGSHQLQFGMSFIRPWQTSTFCVYCNGLFTFSGANAGNAMADFIAGALGSLTQLNISHDDEYWRYIGIYAQDSWKINSRLTLNYGLRWEPYLNGTFHNHQISHFIMEDFLNNVHSSVFPNAPAGTFYPGDSQFPTGSRPNKTTWTDFAPRIGLAWDPTGSGKTLIRASWGIFYDMPQTLFYYNASSQPLWGEGITIIPPSGTANTFTAPWSYYPTGVSPFPTTQNATTAYPTGGYYETVPLNVSNTYVEQWNLTIQKQLANSWLLKASYLGNEITHLWMDKELNPAVYIPGTSTGAAGSCGFLAPVPAAGKACSSTGNTQARRLLTELNPSQGPFYGTTEYLDDSGTGNYHALILSAEHRFTNHFSVLANYTYSHCIADSQTTELSGPVYTDPSDPRFDRGNCPYIDVHHNFNLSGVLRAPHFSSGVLKWVASDWQLAPIIGAHTGSYFTVTTGVDDALTGIGLQRPNQVLADPYCTPKHISSVNLSSPTANCWISAAAFAQPALGTLGTSKMNSLEGPGYIDFDASVSRQFAITERQGLEIRWETFNVANHANFLNPGTAGIAAGGTNGTVLNSSTFGKIQSDVAPRIMQFAVKYIF
jgi:Carboxypeptidase regulatory-like domain/TonB dependent receptor